MAHHWTPLETLRRLGPSSWLMLDGSRQIAHLQRVRVQVGDHDADVILATTWAVQADERLFIGYFVDLLMASTIVWREWSKEQAHRRLEASLG